MTWRKRIFDIFFALILVVILGPVLIGLLVYLLIKQGRPLFFVAERMKGPNQPFNLWKLRTMTVVSGDQGVSGGDKAARITPTGAWLRAKRLDEFPRICRDVSRTIRAGAEIAAWRYRPGDDQVSQTRRPFVGTLQDCQRNRGCLLSNLCAQKGPP